MTPPDLSRADSLERWLDAVHRWLLDSGTETSMSTAADLAEISRSHLQNLLSGRRPIRARHVGPLARALGLDAQQTEKLATLVAGGSVGTSTPKLRFDLDTAAADGIAQDRALLRAARPGTWAVRAWVWSLPEADAARVFAAGEAALSSRTSVQNPTRIRVFLRAFPATQIEQESSMEAGFSPATSLTNTPGGATVLFKMKPASAIAEEPDILDFLDYRAYLHRYYEAARARNRRLSKAWLGQRLGVSGPQVANVLAGRRKLDRAVAANSASALGLRGERADYLPLLVEYNDSTDGISALQAWRQLCLIRARHGRALTEEASSVLLLRWYIPVVLELSMQPGWCADPAWIASRLRPEITADQAEHALVLLYAAGLLGDQTEDAPPLARAPLWLGDELVMRFHDECLDTADATAALGLEPWQSATFEVDAEATPGAGALGALMQRWRAAIEASAGPVVVPAGGAPAHLFLAHAYIVDSPPP